MKVSEVMSRDVLVVRPDQTIAEAAQMMVEADVGALPVAENDRLVGMITDRDIALRAVARRLPPDTPVREVMSPEVLYCYEDEDVEHILDNMGDNQVRRLPVVNRNKRLAGIVSVADLSRKVRSNKVGDAVAHISQPSEVHSQSAEMR